MKKILAPIPLVLFFCLPFLTGCQLQIGGTGNSESQKYNDKKDEEKKKAEEERQKAQLEEDRRLERKRAELAEKEAQIERQRREIAEQQLAAATSKHRSASGVDSDDKDGVERQHAPRHANRVVPRRNCCPSSSPQSNYVPQSYNHSPPVSSGYSTPSIRYAQPSDEYPTNRTTYSGSSGSVTEYDSSSYRKPAYNPPEPSDYAPRKHKGIFRKFFGKIGSGFKAVGRGIKKMF